MAYIGRTPIVGNYQVLDALTATTTDTYALTKNSVAVYPQTPANCIVSLNGVIQAPFDSYTISGSNIVFASALTGSDSIDFITVLGDVLNIGTPSDNTVSLAKLTATGTKDATTFLRGDNTFAEAGGGKVLQVVSATDSTQRSSTSTSFVTASNTLSVSITPSSASNKILILAQTVGHNSTTDPLYFTIFRDATNLGTSSGMASVRWFNGASIQTPISLKYLDSPNTTSAITYQVYMQSNSGTKYINLDSGTGSIICLEIAG